EQEARRILNRALDCGINYLDTARVYGESEAIIGRTLEGRRHEFILNTKVSSFEEEGLAGETLRNRVVESVHQSLRALRTESVDVLMIHSASTEVIARGEMVSILEGFRRAGYVRYLGASVYGEQAALAAIQSGTLDCLQIAYSVLDRRPEKQVLTAAEKHDVGLVARSVLLKGALTTRYTSLPNALLPLRSAIERLVRTTAETDTSDLSELAYRYVLGRVGVHTALVGASSVGELEAAIRYASCGPLSGNVLARLEGLDLDDDELLNPGKWPPV
ncbi:MAG: aldo/keto reductase, partial [Acidobacteriia bacterium]|nr:aldo/keto reductase [Terriglobia bacterium]